jgi:hypothetical protein
LFKGRLRLPSDPGEGIPIDLELEDVFLSLDSAGEDFGEWRLDTVEIKRLFSNQFSMLLDGEEMVFVADDALGFAYDGLSKVEDVQSRLSKRRVFKGRKTPKKKTVAGRTDATEADESPAMPEPVAEPEAGPDAPMPEVVPFFPESGPSFADSVAESAIVDESIAPVAPRPIEIAETPPQIESPLAPSPTPAPKDEEPVASIEAPTTPEPPSVPEPPAEPETAAMPAVDGSSELLGDDDDELVIEDVSAYGYVPVASALVDESVRSDSPHLAEETADAEAVDELEIEEASPATGAVLREVHPLGEADAAVEPPPPSVPARTEIRQMGEPPEPEGVPAAETGTSAPPMPTMPEPGESAEPVPEPSSVPLPPAEAPSFAQWSSNGQAAADSDSVSEPDQPADGSKDRAAPQTQKPGRHARSSGKSKSSLFGRKKSREPEAHEHRYESSKTVGGITRRVCAVCGHVSFAGEDVYQNW